ncbi:MAG: hypothetical protein GEV03_19100 [Streptosporangiales bacterium]|nr:hypothetical protein [Streptosporangiales bacterium]
MHSVRREEHQPEEPDPRRLPQRWAVIATLASTAAAVAGMAGGPVAAIVAGIGVAGGLHAIVE